ncbi:MAG: ATP-binding protein [Peptococcaceae bacterium]|nr:ATP-binding protein [Peptococcaceae bacterium]
MVQLKNNTLPDMLDITLPQALDFAAKTITFGDQVARVMAITAYPPKVSAAFLARLANMPGVSLSIHLNPTDPTDLVKGINRAIGEYSGRIEAGGNALTIQRLEHLLEDAQELLRKLDQEQQQVLYVTVMLLLTAPDAKDLERRTRQIESMLAATGMRARGAIFRQAEGLRAAGPWLTLPDGMKESFSRNMPAETAAAMFPFAVAGINDGKGILLGRDRDGGAVLLDIWKREGDRTNSNLTILAKPGAGKSYAAKMLVLREYLQGSRVIIIDPEREYKDMCHLLGGHWINCGSRGQINPLRARPAPPDDSSGAIEQSSLALHIRTLRTFFSLYLKDLSDLEKAVLEEAVMDVYNAAGIFLNTDVATVQSWPTIKHVYEHLSAKAQGEPQTSPLARLAVLLKRAAEGTDAGLWSSDTGGPAVDAGITVLDIHDLKNAEDAVRKAQYFNVLSHAWGIIERDRQERTILVVDEAWILADPQTPQALAFLRDASKRIRKYMGALVVISQNVVDFLSPEVARHGQALLDNPTYKLLLAQGEKDLQVLSGLMLLSEAEQEFLATANRGEGLLVAGAQRIRVKIEAAPYEAQYLTGGGK